MSSFGSTNAILVAAGTFISQYDNKVDSGTGMFTEETNSGGSGNSVYDMSPQPASGSNSSTVTVGRHTSSNSNQLKILAGNNTSTTGVLLDGTNGLINTQTYQAGTNYEVTVTNDTTTGTINNHTALYSTTGAITPAITATGGVYGIVQTNGGVTGGAQIAVEGKVSCVFDGAVTNGDHVTLSSSVAGDCTDAGATSPTGSQDLGIVLSTSATPGTYLVALNPFPSSVGFYPTTTAGVGTSISSSGNSAVNMLFDGTPTSGNPMNVDFCRNTTASDCSVKVFLGNGSSTFNIQLDGTTGQIEANSLLFAGFGSHFNTHGATTDLSGTIQISAGTSATQGFTTNYNNAPNCVVTPTSDTTSAGAWWVTTATTGITVHTHNSTTVTFNYICTGAPN
jgi:hypothetical protein